MIRWFDDIEATIDEQEELLTKQEAICEAIYNLLDTNELALVFVLYECSHVPTILEKLNIDESTYYRSLNRIRTKLGPYLTDMGILTG